MRVPFLVSSRQAHWAAARSLLVFCSTCLISCATAPSQAPPLVSPVGVSASSVRLQGPRGPLSAQQSRAIIGRLKSQQPDSSLFDRHLAIEQAIVGSPLMSGNRVTVLVDGESTYQSMWQAIDQAKDHIHMESYIFEDDDIGHRFVDKLIDKQKGGVQVSLIYDSVGSINTSKAFFKNLADNGIKVLEYNPINPLHLRKDWELNQRDHRKLLVVDGRIAFIGGINISNVYSGGSSFSKKRSTPHPGPKGKDDVPWRDTHLRMEGPVAREFQKLFLDTWTKQKGTPLPEGQFFPQLKNEGIEVVRAIGSSPEQSVNLTYAALLSAINTAESHICITNAYFVPDPSLRDALKEAAQRGVDVKLLLPGKTDSSVVAYASRYHYAELLEAGVKIYERQDALLHAKTAVVDGVWTAIGSTNLDWRSLLHNQEIDAVVLGQTVGDRMLALFNQDLARSKPITPEQWDRRPVDKRLKEIGARIWAYWL